jgi:hypothetical protein
VTESPPQSGHHRTCLHDRQAGRTRFRWRGGCGQSAAPPRDRETRQ